MVKSETGYNSIFGGASFGIVMTDLFLSATAALLVVLALANEIPATKIPIQADLISYCVTNETMHGDFELRLGKTLEGPFSYVVRTPKDLALAPVALGLPPRLYYTLALMSSNVAGDSSKKTFLADCAAWADRKIISKWNRNLNFTERGDTVHRAVFGIALATISDLGGTFP